MMAAFDAYVVFKNITTVTRKCPFCGANVEDLLGASNDFVAHLASPIPGHQEKKEWAEFVASIDRASESKALGR